jgi:hypothetical protein
MPYDYSPKVLQQWDWPAQAEAYRMKFEHEQRRATFWQARALTAEARIAKESK